MRHVSFAKTSPVIFNLLVTIMMNLILLTGIPHQITLVKPWNYNASRINLIILVSTKGQKRVKSKFVTKFIGIIVTIFIKIPPKFLIKIFASVFSPIHSSLETQNRKQNNLQYTLSKSSPTMCTLVEELSDCYDYFFRILGFPDIFGFILDHFWILLMWFFNYSFARVNKTLYLVFFIIQRDYNGYKSSHKSSKKFKKKLALCFIASVKKHDWVIHEKLFA